MGCRTVGSARGRDAERLSLHAASAELSVLHASGVQNGRFCTWMGCRTVGGARGCGSLPASQPAKGMGGKPTGGKTKGEGQTDRDRDRDLAQVQKL